MAYQIRILLLSAILTLVTFASSYDHQHRMAVDRIKRYAKRQIPGNCLYNMCNETDGYPADEIEQMIEKKAEYKELFGTVVAPYKLRVDNRFGEIVGEETMCKTESIYMLPQKAVDADGAWQIVVNIAEKFEQIVRFEACAPDAVCYAQEHMPHGFRTSCEVQTVMFRMVVVGGEGELKMGHFPLPAGCFCKYRFGRRFL